MSVLALLWPLAVVDFASRWALWGLVTLAAPIVVHLLFRHKPRVVKFPAIRLLLASHRQTSRRFRLKQLLLLLLRLAVIAGFVTALAGPRLVEHRTAAARGKRRVNAVLVLDHSYSMGHIGRDGSSRLDRAKALVLQLLDLFSPDSRLALLWCSDRPEVAVGAFTFDREAIREKVNQTALTCRTTDCAASLREAYRLFRTEQITEARAIFLFTDNTLNAWRAPVGDKSPLARSTPVFVVDVGDEESENRYVSLPSADIGVAAVGLALAVEARITLPPGVAAASAELVVDRKPRDKRYVRAEGAATHTFRFLPERGGLVCGHVGLRGSDPIEADDKAYFAVPCGARRKVVVVDGQTARTRGPSAAFFLTRALAPHVPGIEPPVDCHLLVPASVAKAKIDEAQAVVLLDVPRLREAQWSALADHVAGGAALIIFAGPQLDPTNYTARAHDPLDPRGAFLPCTFGRVRRDGKPFGLRVGRFDHPFLRPFETENPNLREPRFTACIETTPVEDKPTNIILRFTNGLPALLEQGYGEGRTIVFTSDAGRQWGNFPQVPHAYVPFVHELVRYGTGSRARRAWVHVGEAVRIDSPTGRPLSAARLRGPEAGRWSAIALPRDEKGQTPRSVGLPPLEGPGIYRVELTAGQTQSTEPVAVNVDTRESTPERVEPKQLAAFVPGGNVHVVRAVRELVELLEVGGSATDLNRYLLPLVLALLVAELLLANHMYARGAARPTQGDEQPSPASARQDGRVGRGAASSPPPPASDIAE